MTILRPMGVLVLTACSSHAPSPAQPPAPAPMVVSTAAPVPSVIAAVNVVDFGAKGDGVTDDRAAITAALAQVAKAGGGTVVFPPGIYSVGREGRAPFSLDLPCDNCTLVGVKGRSWLQHPKGMPADSVSLLRIDRRSHVTIRDLGFDGNWGNSVGGTDSVAGINHATQGDPKNYLLMLRSATDVAIESTAFRQAYGDCIWIGASQRSMPQPSENIAITDVTCDMAARDGIALGQAARGIHVTRSRFTNIFAQAFDTEPVNQGVEDVTIEDSELGGWWNIASPKRSVNSPLSIVGGNPTSGPSKAARHYRVRNNLIHGSVIIATASDVVLEGNRILADWEGFSYSPVTVRSFADDITIANNEIYARTHFQNGAPTAAVSITYYAAGKITWSPANVRVAGNHIHIRDGNVGVAVDGAGAHAGLRDSGKAALVTPTTITDDRKQWTPGAWIGATLRIGGASAIVAGNTATELQLSPVTVGTASAWMSALGAVATMPAAGAYTLGWTSGTVDVVDNLIDAADDGAKAGGTGIALAASRPAGRVRIRGNTIKNATGPAIRVKQWDKARSFDLLEIADNHAFDDRAAAVTTSVLQFDSPVFASQLVLRNNTAGVGVASAMSGTVPSWWAVDLGTPPRFAGPGSPEGKVPALLGALYQRVDAAGGAALYAKASGSGTTGWEPMGGAGGGTSAPAVPAWVSEHRLVAANVDPTLPMTGVTTARTGQVTLVRVRAYGPAISKILLDVEQPPSGVTRVLLGLYRGDGGQTAEMARATIDAVGVITKRGVKEIAFAAPVSVTPGDDLYVAILPVGKQARALRLHGPATSAIVTALAAGGDATRGGTCCDGARTLPSSVTPGAAISVPWIGLR